MYSNPMIPAAIIVAGGLIAGGLLLRDGAGADGAAGHNAARGGDGPLAAERAENPYIAGNPDAPVKVVEFSDFECPFCSRLHPTLSRVVEESDGQVAWEYRHLPLPSHQNAEEAAYAGECIGRLGGNDAFWEFADAAFANQRGFSTDFFEGEAERLGVPLSEFRSCVKSDAVASIVARDRDAALSLGGRGTPFSVIVYEDGRTRPVSGALPYETWAELLPISSE